MSKKIKKFVGMAAPFAALIPGIGPLAAAAIGAGGGLLSGGGLKGALLGGVAGGLGGGWGNTIARSAGLSGALGGALSKGLTGAAMGAASGGGLKGALLGGALGGAGGAFTGGGGTLGGLLGDRAYSLPAGVQGPVSQGSGIMGALTRGGTNLASGGGTSAFSSALAPVLSGGINAFSGDQAADALESQQKRALGLVSPFMNEQFTPGDLSQTPGYQFQLGQGQKAIDQAASARGNYFSGQSLTDANNYAQELAGNTYQNAYQNWLNDRNQRMSAATSAAGITQGIGETRATNILNQGQNLAQSGSALLGGMGGGNIYNPKTGTYYDPNQQGISQEMLLRMLGGR